MIWQKIFLQVGKFHALSRDCGGTLPIRATVTMEQLAEDGVAKLTPGVVLWGSKDPSPPELVAVRAVDGEIRWFFDDGEMT